MAAIQHSFLILPSDNRAQIFDHDWGDGQNLEHRLICKSLLPVINGVIRKKWEELQKIPALGPFGFEEACSRIKKKYSANGSYSDGFNYLELFRSLNREWQMIGVTIHRGPLNVTPAYQVELQTHLYHTLNDASLMRMWDRILPKLYQFAWAIQGGASARDCLGRPHIQMVLSSFNRMDFSDLEIRFIPVEMSYFSGLTELKLCRNNIDFLPDFIGNLKNLQILDLEDNDLQMLPKGFPNWTHLKVVNLKDNPLNEHGLQQFAEWEANVAALRAQDNMDLD